MQNTQRNLHEVGSASATVRDRLPNRVGVYTAVRAGRVVIVPKPADLFDAAISRIAFGLIKAAGKFSEDSDYATWEEVSRVKDRERLANMVRRLNTDAADKYTSVVDAMCDTILNEKHDVVTRARKAGAAATDTSVDEIEV